jgi:hypothetical protein
MTAGDRQPAAGGAQGAAGTIKPAIAAVGDPAITAAADQTAAAADQRIAAALDQREKAGESRRGQDPSEEFSRTGSDFSNIAVMSTTTAPTSATTAAPPSPHWLRYFKTAGPL